MSLEQKVMAQMKDAMKSKDEAALRSLRAIKSEIIKAKAEPGAQGEINEQTEMKILQKMVKQRKDSYDIYRQQNREDLANKEQEEIDIIETFLPKQMDENELTAALQKIIAEHGSSSPSEMGKLMGVATKTLAGRADGKSISAALKNLLK